MTEPARAMEPGEASVTVLIAEGDADKAERISRMLESDARIARIYAERACDLGSLLGMLSAGSADAIILDPDLPDSMGLATIAAVTSAAPSSAVIVVSDRENEHMAVDAIRLGAQDFIPTTRADRYTLCRSIRRAVERKRLQEYQAMSARTLDILNRDGF